MAAQDNSEKTEQPTEFKLREARGKGMVWKSPEAGAALSVALLCAWVYAFGALSINSLARVAERPLLSWPAFGQGSEMLMQQFGLCLQDVLQLVLPFTLLMLVAGVGISLLQTGLIFSTHSVKPDLHRLNPIQGFKKLFSVRTIYETVRSIIKIALMALVTGHFLWSHGELLVRSALESTTTTLVNFSAMAAVLLARLVMVLLIFVVVDLFFQRAQFMKQMRMSKQELKDEVKRREGDPQIRAKRRKLQDEQRKKSSRSGGLAGSDLVVSNPEHFAVAIRFDRETMRVPQVTIKGTDAAALRIQQDARIAGIPVIRKPALARALYRTAAAGDEIRPDYYLPVAELLVRAYKLRRNASSVMGDA